LGIYMDETEEIKPLITAQMTVSLARQTHEKVTVQLFDDQLVFCKPDFSRTLRLGSLLAVHAADYSVTVSTGQGDIVLSMIGYLYEDFSHKFIRAFNEVIYKQLLMKEAAHFEALGQYISPSGETVQAVFRICETALVILPETHMLVRVPFCMIADVLVEPYRFTVTDRLGRVFVLQKLGRLTDPFLREYNKRISELRKQTRDKLSEIAPVDDALADLLMEGMIVPLADVSAMSPSFADALQSRLEASEIAPEFAYLQSLSDGGMAVGIKRGLMGELTGETIHTLTPVFEKNAVILESLGEGAAATYVFRMSADGSALCSDWRQWLLAFNDSMLAVNYRREPIYLSEEALKADKYENYRGALQRSEGLKTLRMLFAGRAAHTGFESWEKTIESFLV
jgi:hypothetical protein